MSRKLKTVGFVLAALIVLGGLAVMGIFSAVNYYAVKIGTDIYGGPFPGTIQPTFAAQFSSIRLAWFKDTSNNLQVVIFQDPAGGSSKSLLCPPNLDQAIGKYQQFDFIIRGITGASDKAFASRIQLGTEPINTQVYLDPLGQTSHLGVMNLDKAQILFIATRQGMSQDSHEVAQFFQAMPALQHDSHFRNLHAATHFATGAKEIRLTVPKQVK